MNRPAEYVLRVGGEARLKKGIFSDFTLVFAGMPSDRTYSLVVSWTCGYKAAAYNLFFPESQREIPLADGTLTVTDVSPQEIRFRHER